MAHGRHDPAPDRDPRVAGLLPLLAAPRPADDEEASHLARLAALLETSLRPFDRGRFAPGHATASGFVLHPDGRRLLLVRHRRLGIWVQPGGHVDPADGGPEAAARREVAEETGIAGLVRLGSLLDVDVHDFPARPGGEPAHRHFDVRFAYAAAGAALDPNDEVDEVRWVARDELRDLGVDRSILRPAAKLLGVEASPDPL